MGYFWFIRVQRAEIGFKFVRPPLKSVGNNRHTWDTVDNGTLITNPF